MSAPASRPAADGRVPHRAPALLRPFGEAGVLDAADVHVATRLGRLSDEEDERVLLAVALAVRALRAGSVCLRLEEAPDLAGSDVEAPQTAGPGLPWPEPEEWAEAVRRSPMVAEGPRGPADRPVRWVGGRLYLDRYWRDELLVRRAVTARLAEPLAVDEDRLTQALRRLFPAGERQREAALLAARSRLTVLTGGPGTGKTTTVARLLAVLQDVAGPGLRVALAAPTGKAAARLQEAVREAAGALDPADRDRLGEPAAATLHRLLGWRPGSTTRFRHDRNHHLPQDVVVVDETSMVPLSLMARLLEALRPQARLVLVGDPDQLASVEAGAVLGDLVARSPQRKAVPVTGGLGAGVVRLETVYRQSGDSAILPLAEAIRTGRAEEAVEILRRGAGGVELVEVDGGTPGEEDVAAVREDVVRAGAALATAARAGDADAALRALEEHRLLLAHRRGPAGVTHWTARVERWLAEAGVLGVDPAGRPASVPGHAWAAARPEAWYPGQPLLVTANDRETGLHNGDTGVIVADATPGELVAVFGEPAQPLWVRPHRLPPAETVHAMTVHRAQGSQFGTVSLILPSAPTAEQASPLLTRELLYTAVTRARRAVRVIGTAEAVLAAVTRPIRRASGLNEPL